jgi:serine/threonine protein kinase
MSGALVVSQPDWEALLLGQKVGDYTIDRRLGEGAFGLVFEAISVLDGTRVAIKILKPGVHDPGAVLDFENEGALLQQLGSCNGVINFIDSGNHVLSATFAGGISIPISMPYQALALASGSLDEISSDPSARHRLDLIEALRLWRSATLSLMRMHQHGVAHRDLKCSNCLVMVTKSGDVIRFGDLGRAKDMSLPPTHAVSEYARGRGDLFHAPPEAIFWQGGSSKADFLAADYYGLGSLLVELLTGFSITRLAIGDMNAAVTQGRADFVAGSRRELSVLLPKYESVIGGVVDVLPRSIQLDVRQVLETLCNPEPEGRLAASPFSRDRNTRENLEWVLRRIDIAVRRLKIERRAMRRRERSAA